MQTKMNGPFSFPATQKSFRKRLRFPRYAMDGLAGLLNYVQCRLGLRLEGRTLSNCQPRLICVRPWLLGLGGHFANDTLGVIHECPRHNMDYIILCNRAASPELLQHLPAIPTFPLTPHSSRWPVGLQVWFWIALFHEHVTPRVQAEDWVYLADAEYLWAAAAVKWLSQLPARCRPWLIINFMAWTCEKSETIPLHEKWFKYLTQTITTLKDDQRRRIILGVDEAKWAQSLSAHFGLSVLTVPTLKMPDDFATVLPLPTAVVSDRLCIALPGNLNLRKGAALLPEIIRACNPLLDVEFQVQSNLLPPQRPEAAILNWLRVQPNVRLLAGPLSRTSYLQALRKADLVLLPYQPEVYADQPSGIFVEAAALGIPLVVPAGTWMAEQITAGRAAGVIFAPYTAEAAAAALQTVATHLSELREQASRHVPFWRASQSSTAFFDVVLREIEKRY